MYVVVKFGGGYRGKKVSGSRAWDFNQWLDLVRAGELIYDSRGDVWRYQFDDYYLMPVGVDEDPIQIAKMKLVDFQAVFGQFIDEQWVMDVARKHHEDVRSYSRSKPIWRKEVQTFLDKHYNL